MDGICRGEVFPADVDPADAGMDGFGSDTIVPAVKQENAKGRRPIPIKPPTIGRAARVIGAAISFEWMGVSSIEGAAGMDAFRKTSMSFR
jgi:hypothetical protein